MNRFTKPECLSLFRPKENTEIDFADFVLLERSQYSISNTLEYYNSEYKQWTYYCPLCDCDCDHYYCDGCNDALGRICEGKKIFSIKLKYKYTSLMTEIPIFGMSEEELYISIMVIISLLYM